MIVGFRAVQAISVLLDSKRSKSFPLVSKRRPSVPTGAASGVTPVGTISGTALTKTRSNSQSWKPSESLDSYLPSVNQFVSHILSTLDTTFGTLLLTNQTKSLGGRAFAAPSLTPLQSSSRSRLSPRSALGVWSFSRPS